MKWLWWGVLAQILKKKQHLNTYNHFSVFCSLKLPNKITHPYMILPTLSPGHKGQRQGIQPCMFSDCGENHIDHRRMIGEGFGPGTFLIWAKGPKVPPNSWGVLVKRLSGLNSARSTSHLSLSISWHHCCWVINSDTKCWKGLWLLQYYQLYNQII